MDINTSVTTNFTSSLSSACAGVNTYWADLTGGPPTSMLGQVHQTNGNPIQVGSEVWYGVATDCQHISDGYYVFNLGSPGVSSTYVIDWYLHR